MEPNDLALLRGRAGVDPIWYRATYPDIGSVVDPVEHYATIGWRERRSPNQWFSTEWYLRHYPDVQAAEVDPLLHFLRHGRTDGRSIAPHEFLNPIAWLRGPWGVAPKWYVETYRLAPTTDAAAHYGECGWREGKDPNPSFSTEWYLATNPDVAAAGMNPLRHFLQYGRLEGRTPKPSLWDTLRVANWWIKLAPIAAVMYATAYRLDVPLLLLAPLLLLGLAAIATLAVYVSLINDLSDRAEDSACGKRNGLFGKSPRAVAGLLAACILPGALFTYYWRNDATLVALYLGGWVAFSAYSVPPVRLKSRGIWGIAADALGAHVMPKLFATLLIYRHQAASVDAPWLTAVSVWSFCYGLRGIMWHQLMDRGNDAAVGLQTFVRARDRKTLRRLAHGIVFPCEVVALVYMLWLTASLMAAAFLPLYLLLEWRRVLLSASPIILVPRAGQAPANDQYQLRLFHYYEYVLPSSFLLACALRHPADLAVGAVHVLVFAPPIFRHAACTALWPIWGRLGRLVGRANVHYLRSPA